jgi:CheY-like chemotaxis protein
VLVEAMSKEVLESCLPIQTGSYELVPHNLLAEFPKFCRLQIRRLVEESQLQLRQRQSAIKSTSVNLSANVSSNPSADMTSNWELRSYSQPIGAEQAKANLLQNRHVNCTVNLPTIAELTNQRTSDSATEQASEHKLDHTTEVIQPQAKSAFSSSPFQAEARLEAFIEQSSAQVEPNNLVESNLGAEVERQAQSLFQVNQVSSKIYKIACIDDSPVVLKTINSFLDDKSFSVVLISDPVRALMQIIRTCPDLILLDVTMPNLDGYELCSLLRKHPKLRTTPIIMVTSSTRFIDRAKAKLVGSSGYLAKPFTQSDLLKSMFKHLN